MEKIAAMDMDASSRIGVVMKSATVAVPHATRTIAVPFAKSTKTDHATC